MDFFIFKLCNYIRTKQPESRKIKGWEYSFFKKILLAYSLFKMLAYSVQQSELVIHIPIIFWILFPDRSLEN